MKRAFLGAFGGALIGGVLAAAIPSVLFGAQFLYYLFFAEHNYPPLDQVLDSAPVLFVVAFSGVVGTIVGALAGVASRVPASGVSFLRCCIFIALAAGTARLLTMPRHYDGNDYSYIASVVAALIATGVLILVGLNRGICPMSTTTQPPKPKRRWYRFSLKTLLIVMTVATVAFGGWVQYRRNRAQENRDRVAVIEDAVAAIQELDGKVWSEYQELRPQTWSQEQFSDPGGPDDPVGVLNVARVELIDTDATDADLENIEVLTKLDALRLDRSEPEYSNITDAGLEHLTGLTNLRELWLSGTNVTDAGLEHLTGLTELEFLCLDETKVAGLEHLRSLTSLCFLHLLATNVTDTGLEHLSGLTNLLELNLSSTNVSDAGLEHLMGLTKLEYLGLWDTAVTDEGVNKLQQALPNCKIEH